MEKEYLTVNITNEKRVRRAIYSSQWSRHVGIVAREKDKVSSEIGLSYLAYNLKRAINLVGVKRFIEAMG